MGGEVDVYEVRRYRAAYIGQILETVEKRVSAGDVYWQIAETLRKSHPARIKVGKQFYDYAARIAVEQAGLIREYQKNRYRIRAQTIKKGVWADPEETAKKLSASKKASMVAYRHPVMTPWGYEVASKKELYAHTLLNRWGVPFEFEVRSPEVRGRADLQIGGQYVEIDGMARDPTYWKRKYPSGSVIVVKCWQKDWERRLYYALYRICKNQGYTIRRSRTNV